ncbi:hypothetical protein [Paenibacillus bouchesdurhonensis]|uniref:hypothetical protein n=1 Tax=Paenibacillus bouchesdurhonensis TaxID=1870990 RepID=UPI000DA5F451|nr:hypothetical protein [Paenibacillus bouchesdurhonensis]
MGIERPIYICQCGCDEEIPYSPRHQYPSKKPKYKVGHFHRNKFFLNRNTIENEYKKAGSGAKLAEKYGITPVAVYNMLRKIKASTIPKEELAEPKQRTGRYWELKCLDFLEGAEDFSGMDWRSPFDLIFNGYRVNVKVSNPVNQGKTWTFNTRSKQQIDYFLCIGLNESGEVEKLYWIPSDKAKKQTTIRRGSKTKYDEYATTFELLNHKRQDTGY